MTYTVYCLEIPTIVPSARCLQYADDTKLFLAINNVHDIARLQHALDALYEWSVNNKLSMNVNKTCCVSITRKRTPIPSSYSINGVHLEKTDHYKDLGIIVDSKFKFKMHINNAAQRATQLAGCLRRFSIELKCPKLNLSMYNAYILPIVEYGSPVWDMSFITLNYNLERPLRLTTRAALCLPQSPLNSRYLTYERRLSRLELETAETRRQYILAKTFIRILRNELHCPTIAQVLAVSLQSRPLATRRQDYLYIGSTVNRNSPMFRAMRLINTIARTHDVNTITYHMVKQLISQISQS